MNCQYLKDDKTSGCENVNYDLHRLTVVTDYIDSRLTSSSVSINTLKHTGILKLRGRFLH